MKLASGYHVSLIEKHRRLRFEEENAKNETG